MKTAQIRPLGVHLPRDNGCVTPNGEYPICRVIHPALPPSPRRTRRRDYRLGLGGQHLQPKGGSRWVARLEYLAALREAAADRGLAFIERSSRSKPSPTKL